MSYILGFGFEDLSLASGVMDEEPPKRSLLRTVILPVIVASLFAAAIFIFVPEVGAFAAISAWLGTVLFMSIWGSFYS